MCVDCVLASSRIAQVDTGDEPLPEVVLSQPQTASDTAGPSSRPQEDIEADRGAVKDQGDDITRDPAGDRPEAIKVQGNEV
jgi:hypothetical protein